VNFDIRRPIPAQLCGKGSFDIFNFASVHTTPGHEDWEYYWTNVHGATNVCKFATDVSADYLLFTSTMMVYGPTEAPKDEDSLVAPNSGAARHNLRPAPPPRLCKAGRPAPRRLTIVRPGFFEGLAKPAISPRLSRALKGRRFIYPGRIDTVKACGYVDDL